jgi:hypothetical protein
MQIIDLLRKLIASEKSEREIGNQAAAEAFAAKAQELLLKHKLEMTDVEFAAEEIEEPVLGEQMDASEMIGMPDKMKSDRWISVLLTGIADANFCKVLSGRGNRFVVVGRASDRAATSALFIYLSQACIEMAPKHADTNGYGKRICPSALRRSFLSSFKIGFAVAIYQRLRVKKAELKAGAQVQGLIRIDQMERAVADKFKEMFPHTRNGGAISCRNNQGYQAGKSYGGAVGINSTKRLGA